MTWSLARLDALAEVRPVVAYIKPPSIYLNLCYESNRLPLLVVRVHLASSEPTLCFRRPARLSSFTSSIIYSLACPSYSQEAKAAFQTACRREWQAEHDASPLDYPVTALEALNQVLFERHGYTKPEFHHNNSPDNSLLPKVLEQGKGSPLLLGVVYMEVAHRMGLPLEGAPLSEGKSVTN
eukprot:1196317-Prorocentrum_minimum.AAC.5